MLSHLSYQSAQGDPDDASVVDERDDTGRPDDGMRACCYDGVGKRWMKLFCAARAEACELNKSTFDQVQERGAAVGGPVGRDVLIDEACMVLPKNQGSLGARLMLCT